MIIENPKELTKKKKKNLLGQISNYNNIVGYNTNVQKSIAFLYTSNGQVEFEIKNIIPFTLVSPKCNT